MGSGTLLAPETVLFSGSRAGRPMNISPGTKLGPYELLERIGSGGMGEVYRAHDTRLNRVVAVKVLLGTAGADPAMLRRFEQEARTLAALNHPNILAVHDIGSIDGTPYLVSEFLEGDTLSAKLNAGPLPVRRAIEYALGIADGLAAGHSKGLGASRHQAGEYFSYSRWTDQDS